MEGMKVRMVRKEGRHEGRNEGRHTDILHYAHAHIRGRQHGDYILPSQPISSYATPDWGGGGGGMGNSR
jgi:hypothetical protein